VAAGIILAANYYHRLERLEVLSAAALRPRHLVLMLVRLVRVTDHLSLPLLAPLLLLNLV
jgi:hypothetical protein